MTVLRSLHAEHLAILLLRAAAALLFAMAMIPDACGEIALRSVPVLRYRKESRLLEVGYGKADGIAPGQLFAVLPREFFTGNRGAPIAIAEVKTVSRKLSVLRIHHFCGEESPITPGLETAPLTSLAEFSCVEKGPPQLPDDDSHFSLGYFAYLTGDFPTCASQLLFGVESGTEWIAGKSRLYLAACQAMLGNRIQAAANLDKVDTARLDKTDSALQEKLSATLAEELTRMRLVYTNWSLYAGPLLYGSNSPKKSGSIFGARGGIKWTSWWLGFGAEHTGIRFRSTATDFRQNQLHASAGQKLGEKWRPWLGFTLVNASTATVNAQVALAGADYLPDERTVASAELALSRYPKTGLGAVYAAQLTAGLNKRMIQGLKSALWLKGGLQDVMARSSASADPATGYALRGNYLRAFLQAEMVQAPFSLGLSGWLGSEAFGVRDKGYLVNNWPEERTSGLGAFFDYLINRKFSARFSASREVVRATSPISVSAYTLLVNFSP